MAKKIGRPKEEDTIENDGGITTVAVGTKTRDKLREKAGDIPLSKYLRRLANSGYELKGGDSVIDQFKELVIGINDMAAFFVTAPEILYKDADSVISNLRERAEKLDAAEAELGRLSKQAFNAARQLKLPEISTRAEYDTTQTTNSGFNAPRF